jgi:cardiolipin synthase
MAGDSKPPQGAENHRALTDRRGALGTEEWQAAFEQRLHGQARLARLGHWRSVAPRPPRFIGGNEAKYLRDGRSQLAWMLGAIDAARTRIDLEMYIFDPDEAGTRVLAALVRAAERGVLVRLLYDSIGCVQAGPEFFEPLRLAGGHVVEFNPVAPWRLRMSRLGKMQHWEPNYRDHRKLLVCDAPLTWAASDAAAPPPENGAGPRCALAITGGRNIADNYLLRSLGGGQWRDGGVVLMGPCSAELGLLFDAMWFHADGPDLAPAPLPTAPAGDIRVLAIGSQPGFINLLQWALNRMTYSVREELRISCAYFVPSARWRRALVNVAKRTGRCAILVPRESDVPAVDAASRHLMGALLKAGVTIYRYASQVLHDKTYIYDRCVTVLGSSNLDPRSFRLNYELSVIIVDERFAAPVVRGHEHDLEESARYTLDEWRARPVWQRLTDWFWSLLRGQL